MLFLGAGPVELDCLSDEPARESIEPLPVVMQLPDHNHGSGSLGAATFFLARQVSTTIGTCSLKRVFCSASPAG